MAENVFGRWALEFVADSKGLKSDLDKLELTATKSATHIEQSLATGFNAGVAKAREGMGNLAEFAGSAFGRVAAYVSSPVVAITGLSAALGAFMVSAIRDAAAFDRAYNEVRLQLYGTGTNVNELKGRLLDLTPSMATAADKAGALGQVLAKGFSPDEAIKLLDIASKLSRVTGVDLNTAAEMLTETLRAYGLGVQDAERVSNVLLTTLQKAGGPQGVGNMIMGLGRIIPIAHELHIPLEQVTAALVTMQQQGIEGSRAAMALAMILQRATTEAQKFRDANIDIYQVAATHGIPGVLKAIREVSGGTNEDLKSMGIESRTMGVMLALAGEGAGRFAENLKAAGALSLDKLVKETQDLSKSTMDLKTAWEDLKVSIGTVAIPPLTALTKGVADVARGVTRQTGAERTAAIATILAGVSLGMGQPELAVVAVIARQLALRQAAQEKVQKEAGQAGAGAAEGIAGAPFLRAGAAERVAAGLAAAVPRQKSMAEIAADRERLERQSKTSTESTKLQEDFALHAISLDKEIAETRKVTEIELLAFDRATLETRLHFEDQRRAARLATIQEELAGLRETIPEEKKQMEALAVERQRLIQEGLTAHEQANQQRTLLDQKAFTAAQKLDDQLFEHRKKLELVGLRDEIAMLQRRVDSHRGSVQEQMKNEEDLYAKKKELREKDRAENASLTEKAVAELEKEGMGGFITGGDIERKIQEQTARNIELAQRAQGGYGMSAEDWRQAMGAPAAVEQYAGAMQREGSLANLRQAGMAINLPRGMSGLDLGLGRMGFASVLQENFGEPRAPGMGPAGGMADGIKREMVEANAALDEGLTRMKVRAKEGWGQTVQGIRTNWRQLARDTFDESTRE